MGLPDFNLVNTLLFPTPQPSYGVDDFPEELIWVPKNMDPADASPEDCVPCIILSSPSARFFVLYLHSNAEDLGRCYTFCSMLRYQFQVHVLAVEYPGYGICPGEQANEETVTENAFVAFRFLHQVLQWPLDGIIVFGRSIGCGPALAVAAEHAVYGVILVCPFLSVRQLCRDFVGPLADLIDERFPNKDRVALLSSPLLLVHGKKDTVVPWTHGKTLYEVCKSRKRLVTPENMHHNTNLHSDASYFVLPMLQFFGLPDYDFNDMRVPAWAFDKRLSSRYHFNAAGGTACQSADVLRGPIPGAELQPYREPQLALGPKASPRCANAAGASPCPSVQSLEAMPRMLDTSACATPQPCDRETFAVQSEGSTVSSEDVKRHPDMREEEAEEVAAAAVKRFLRVQGFERLGSWDGSREEQAEQMVLPSSRGLPPDSVLASPTATQADVLSQVEEPPEPPDDRGFIKVPRSRMGGPDLHRPMVTCAKAADPLDWALGWWTPRQPKKTSIQI
mmetsp:Transcript_77929/g.252231  ORF Transcript_77929/g.252231 Transcript_77929/m.252231 type:complete len:506 (+) Transcript_77929:177-1694(+)